MRLFHERELLFYGCKPSGPPRGTSANGEPMYDLRDILPISKQGIDWLRDIYRECVYLNDVEGMRRSEPYRGDRYVDNGHVEDFIKQREEVDMTKMNEKEVLATALLDNFTTVLCEYRGCSYTFKKPLDMMLEKDDDIVVSLNDGSLRITTVSEVHDCVVNPDDIKLAWIVQRIDTTQYKQLLEMDKMAVAKIREMERRKAKRELLAEFSDSLNETEQKQLGTDLGIDLDTKS